MSENQLSKPAPDSDHRTAQDIRIDDVNTSLIDSTEQMTIESIQPDATVFETEPISSNDADPLKGAEAPTADWETAPLLGTVDVSTAAKVEADPKIESARENELLTLIHDLNDCNDVLLSRVSQLETALNESQRTLQQADERSRVEKNKIAGQLSAEQLTAQQASQNAQQQVANVVDQLEAAEQSLQRQQLINETLQSELNNAQDRVSQLEHECALGAQQHAKEAQSRVQAETTIRDLRSRLQRQQRYTLQFKAALEKSLTVTARSAETTKQGGTGSRMSYQPLHATARPTPFSDPIPDVGSATSGGVTMPKAQRIMPWAGSIASPFEGIDPHLENLIRGVNAANSAPASSPILADTRSEAPLTFDPSVSDRSPVVDSSPAESDAEDKLWQDMARVIEHSTLEETALASAPVDSPPVDSLAVDSLTVDAVPEEVPTAENSPATEKPEIKLAEATTAADITEPKLNWQRKAVPSDAQLIAQSVDCVANSPVTANSVSDTVANNASEPLSDQLPIDPAATEQEPLIQALGQKAPSERAVVIDPYTVPAGQTPAAEVAFTEPSPWGQPVQKAVAQANSSADLSTTAANAENDYLSVLDGDAAAVAPAANPLRPQKKIGSMSAVQLPTFETAKVGSFKR